jgi:hypothetical protein
MRERGDAAQQPDNDNRGSAMDLTAHTLAE